MNAAQFRVLYIAPSVILFTLGRGIYEIVSGALPLNSSFVGWYYSRERGALGLIIYSDSFPPISPEGGIAEMESPVLNHYPHLVAFLKAHTPGPLYPDAETPPPLRY